MKIIVILAFFTMATPAFCGTYILKDSECKVLNAYNLKVINGEANSITSCSTTKKTKDGGVELLCIFSTSKTSTKFYGLETPDFVMVSSELGGIKYIIDRTNKTFQMAQVTMLLKKGIILNKSCKGSVQ